MFMCVCVLKSLFIKLQGLNQRAACLMINANHALKASLWVPQLDSQNLPD